MSLTDKVREHNVSFGRVYPEEDVKAFIKELTEVLMNTESTAFALCELERLAGPALVEEEKP